MNLIGQYIDQWNLPSLNAPLCHLSNDENRSSLAPSVLDLLQKYPSPSYFWTDSSIVLYMYTYSNCIIIEIKIELIFNKKTYNNRVGEIMMIHMPHAPQPVWSESENFVYDEL
jgi:hypothetical protein